MTKLVLVLTFLFSLYAFADSPSGSASEPTSDEHIGVARYVVGGILGVYPGFGIGHAVEGRYKERGWIFTVGEGVSALFVAIGGVDCVVNDALSGQSNCNSGLLELGVIGFFGFKIWEIVDVWAIPPSRHMISGVEKPKPYEVTFGVIPPRREQPALVALNLRF
jgi:hypothetical protein